MRYALISDIHANLPALEAVLADVLQQPDRAATYHLGDLVGYAPWPNETVVLLRQSGIAGVAGNYDSTVPPHGREPRGARGMMTGTHRGRALRRAIAERWGLSFSSSSVPARRW